MLLSSQAIEALCPKCLLERALNQKESLALKITPSIDTVLSPKPIVWIPDTHVLAIGNLQPILHFWNIDTGEVQIIASEAGNTWALAASPDGKTLAVGTQDGFIKLINLRTFRDMATLRGHLTHIKDMSFSPDGSLLISTGSEGSRLWGASRMQRNVD